MPPALLSTESVQVTKPKLREKGEKKKESYLYRSDTVASRYKVINSTLLARIHLIGELPAEKHVSYKKSLRGKIMLDQRAEWGSMDSIQPLVRFHIGWDT